MPVKLPDWLAKLGTVRLCTVKLGKVMGRAAGVGLAGAMLAACSTSSDFGYSIFADPGKYEYHSCPQIADEIKKWSTRERELKDLMAKADQSTGGAAVGFIAYKADYLAAGEELDQLHYTARNKGCTQDEGWRSNAAVR
jgi:hypothetical protein